MDYGLQSMEFSRLEYWSGQPFLSPEALPNSGLLHCRWILYQLSHNLITNALNYLAGKSLISISLVGFSDIFSYLYETNLSVFSFCLSFSISMKIGETVIYPHLEVMSLNGSVPILLNCSPESCIWSEPGSSLLPGCAGRYALAGK